MARDVKIPELGENVQKAEILSVLVKQGDRVEKDQPILEIETDKATLEVPSDVAGVVAEVLVQPGSKAAVGQAVLRVEEDGAAPQAAAAPAPRAPEPEPAPAPAPAPQAAAPAPSGRSEVREVKLPSLGENVAKAEIVSVLVQVGDRVEKDQPILEIETDKASFEVPSDAAGTVQEILVKAGEKAAPGQPVIRVAAAATVDAAGSPPPAGPQKYPVKPETPERPDPTRTENPRTETPHSPDRRPEGTATQARRPEGAVAHREDTNGKSHKGESTRPWSPRSEPTVEQARKAVPAAPSVRRVARELGIEISEVEGTGPRGRISIEDLKAHNRQKLQAARTAKPAARATEFEAPELPDFAKFGEITREEMSGIRRATAKGMTRAWLQIPHVTQQDKADVTELEILRKRYAERVQKAGGKLTMTAILLKVLGSALKAFPNFNASIDMAGESIIYKKYFHVGVAVDTERGLLVPVVRDVDRKNIVQLSIELNEMAEKARARKIRQEDLQGACMTITNLGGIGGTGFTPIVNWPEVAILGVSRSAVEPVWIDGAFQPRTMLPLSLSYDHRLIDGADAARFLRWVAQSLENPFQLLLEG